MQWYTTQDIYVKRAPLLRPRFLFPLTSLNRERRDPVRCGAMDYYREKTSTLLARVTHSFSGKRPSPSPTPQTSPSATSRVGPLNRMLIRSVPFLQSSNFRMNLSSLFSLTSALTRTSPLTMPGSTCRTVRSCVTATMSGCSFYGR